MWFVYFSTFAPYLQGFVQFMLWHVISNMCIHTLQIYLNFQHVNRIFHREDDPSFIDFGSSFVFMARSGK